MLTIAIAAPSPVPFVVGGAEKFWWGLQGYINRATPHRCELLKLPTPDRDLASIVEGYARFAALDVAAYDALLTSKNPAWMARHPNHTCYMLHPCRGLYDTYNGALGFEVARNDPRVAALLDYMAAHAGRHEALGGFLDRFLALARAGDAPPGVLDFPGPFARLAVRFLDGIGLDPGAIRRYAAIAKTIADRTEYFPPGVAVDVIHPPSDLEGFSCGPGRHLFTVSRLDGPKRISLLIDALREVPGDVPLLIAGTGPDEQALRERAAGDARVRFLGAVTDDEVLALYRDAIAVPFVPFAEDYGLVTIEAMKSGKPVITASDAGGPTEFVEPGRTGWVVPPEAGALARALSEAIANREATARMGLAARERVAGVTWENVVARLFGASPARPARRAPRKRIAAAVPFPVFPPRGGGQARMFHLYREFARHHDVTLVSLAAHGEPALDAEIAPGLRETRVPMSAAHHEAEAGIRREADYLQISDVALPALFRLTPDWNAAIASAAGGADLLVASHPYPYPAMRAASAKPLLLDAHNVEFDLKDAMLPANARARALVALTRETEGAACRDARLVLACTDGDAARLAALYDVPRERFATTPNGVDTVETAWLSPERRRALKERLGLAAARTCLFMGSWHKPNVDAVAFIADLARGLPGVSFLVVGTVCLAFDARAMPANVRLLGVVDEALKQSCLESADLALNPMASGSGSNLKVLDYLSAGVPVLTTPVGARGLGLEDGRQALIAEPADFAPAIGRFFAHAEAITAAVSPAGRLIAETRFDWAVVAADALAAMESAGLV